MALLQAARANVLGFQTELAFSWGLNRAIFYAAAKRGFKRRPEYAPRPSEVVKQKPVLETKEVYYLGDEMAYKKEVGDKTYFTIGGEAQTSEGFEKQIENRFGPSFERAWAEAIDLMNQFDKETLLSQRLFYERVYKPKRDELAKKWSSMAKEK
jgi:hypothetical protein